MIDWEEVIKAESTEELKEIKLWLFQENMRLELYQHLPMPLHCIQQHPG